MMMRNIPWDYSQDDLLRELNIYGQYDFAHLPFSDYLGRSIGVAIINFITPEYAAIFQQQWDKTKLATHAYKKPLSIVPATEQGRTANLLRVRDDAPVLPEVIIGTTRVSDDQVRQLVRLAAQGIALIRV